MPGSPKATRLPLNVQRLRYRPALQEDAFSRKPSGLSAGCVLPARRATWRSRATTQKTIAIETSGVSWLSYGAGAVAWIMDPRLTTIIDPQAQRQLMRRLQGCTGAARTRASASDTSFHAGRPGA